MLFYKNQRKICLPELGVSRKPSISSIIKKVGIEK